MKSGPEVFPLGGRKLVGIYNRPDAPAGRRPPSVLFLHGCPGSEKNVDIQRELMRRGVASYSLHFGGSWGSEGHYLFSRLVPEAAAALRFLVRRLGSDPRRLGVFGFSMGGWAALNLAAREPGLRAVAAVAPVGGPEMITPKARVFLRRRSAPLRVRSQEGLYLDFVRCVRGLDPAQAVRRVACPLLLVHGEADDVVPAGVSRRIYAAAPGPKRLVLAPGAEHGFLDRRAWLTRLVARFFLERLG